MMPFGESLVMQFTIEANAIEQTKVHGFSENRNLAYVEMLGFVHCLATTGDKYYNVGYVDDVETAKQWLEGKEVLIHSQY